MANSIEQLLQRLDAVRKAIADGIDVERNRQRERRLVKEIKNLGGGNV